jgi:inhibitor of KinA sporulation pathway (predicted exonuclease)
MAINQALIQKIADSVFNTFQGISVDVCFKQFVDGGFDPSTRKTITTFTPYDLKGLTTAFMKKEIDGDQIKSGDLQLYIKYEDMPITPKLDDKVEIKGVDWDIVDFSDIADKQGAYWFQLRISS